MATYIFIGGITVCFISLFGVNLYQNRIQKRLITQLKASVKTRDEVIKNLLKQLSIITALSILKNLQNGND